MRSRSKRSFVTLTLALAAVLGLALALVWTLAIAPSATAAPAGELHVCPSGCTYSSVQAAVDAANPGAVIKVAEGTYTDIHVRDSITQVVYISKTVTVRGGYTTSDWDVPDFDANPTTLDAQGQGRVVAIAGDITPTVEGLRIIGGSALGLGPFEWGDGGGGVYIRDAAPTISCNVIFGNAADTGSGLLLDHGSGVLSGNDISSNTGDGPAVVLHYSHATVNDNTISHNTGGHGEWGAGIKVFYSEATLAGNTINDNSTPLYGGGVSLQDSNTTLRGNMISGNTASQGGGLHIYYGTSTLSGNIISDNTASWSGGGLIQIGGVLTLVNDVVVDNQTARYGSGMYLWGPSTTLLHTTVARNSGGDGSGVYVTAPSFWRSQVEMTNTIIASHTLGITVTAGSTATMNATLWHANGANRTGAGTINHANDYTGDPALRSDDYHLTSASAAIDKGVDADVPTDIDGDPRPWGEGYDIGADEFIERHVFLPVVLRRGVQAQ